MKLTFEKKEFPLRSPFAIAGTVFHRVEALYAEIHESGFAGRGEAVGAYYLDESFESMAADIESHRKIFETGVTRDRLQNLLLPCGARNAIDCALWDLDAKKSGKTIWSLLNVEPRSLTTVYTLSLSSIAEAVSAATRNRNYQKLKIKLDASAPVERVEAVRNSRPDASIIVDVNQGWGMAELKEYAPALKRLDVEMIEQPLPRGSDQDLAGYHSPVPLGADESCLSMADIEFTAARYSVINIKLDKTGGLTEALALARAAKRLGCDVMVGNMMGSSLSMAPAFVVGQMCRFVDLDGPLLLGCDVEHGLEYGNDGSVGAPSAQLWG